MAEDNSAPLTGAIRVDDQQLRGHIDEVVRSSVDETLNGLLDAEADDICRGAALRALTRAGRYAGLIDYSVAVQGESLTLCALTRTSLTRTDALTSIRLVPSPSMCPWPWCR
jgi:hypothetical protein